MGHTQKKAVKWKGNSASLVAEECHLKPVSPCHPVGQEEASHSELGCSALAPWPALGWSQEHTCCFTGSLNLSGKLELHQARGTAQVGWGVALPSGKLRGEWSSLSVEAITPQVGPKTGQRPKGKNAQARAGGSGSRKRTSERRQAAVWALVHTCQRPASPPFPPLGRLKLTIIEIFIDPASCSLQRLNHLMFTSMQ